MIKFPLTCITRGSKINWLLRAQGLLQEEHNIMGKWYKENEPLIPLELYQKLRAEVQIRWVYTGNKLSKLEWSNYQKERFNVKQKEIGLFLSQLRQKSLFTKFINEPNLDDDII